MSLKIKDEDKSETDYKPVAYLAHRLSHRFEVRYNIQPLLESAFPEYEFKNPFMEHGEYVYEVDSSLEEEVASTYEGDKTPDDIIHDDIGLLEDCDLLIAFVGGAMNVGTPAEIFYNSYVLGRKTILIFDENSEEAKDLMFHPWLLALSDEVKTLKEVYEMVEMRYGERYE